MAGVDLHPFLLSILQLKKLDLICNNLNDEAINQLMQVLQHVEELDLSWNKMITTVGYQFIAEGLKNSEKVNFTSHNSLSYSSHLFPFCVLSFEFNYL